MGFACPSDRTTGLSFVQNKFLHNFIKILNSQLKIPQQSISLPLHHTHSDSPFQTNWVALSASQPHEDGQMAHLSAFLKVADKTTQNLTPAEKELL
jgi:hypothetical protein